MPLTFTKYPCRGKSGLEKCVGDLLLGDIEQNPRKMSKPVRHNLLFFHRSPRVDYLWYGIELAASRHPRSVAVEGTVTATHARIRHRAAAAADLRRRVPDRGRNSVPGSAKALGQRLGGRGMEANGEQSSSKVLQAHRRWAEAIAGRAS